MGRRLAVSAQCHPHESCDPSISNEARAERTDQDGRRRRKRRRRRHRLGSKRSSTSSRFPRDTEDEEIPSVLFLPLDATRWTFFESTCEEVSQCAADPTALRVIIGNY